MKARIDTFVQLSAALTGFGRVDLFGTAMVENYLKTLETGLPEGVVDELLAAFEKGLARGDGEAAIQAVLEDAKLGPVARSLAVLWYAGSWTSLPDDWCASYGAEALDVSRVLSAGAYRAGLQWEVAGAHPPGSKQQGFGAWALAPERSVA